MKSEPKASSSSLYTQAVVSSRSSIPSWSISLRSTARRSPLQLSKLRARKCASGNRPACAEAAAGREGERGGRTAGRRPRRRGTGGRRPRAGWRTSSTPRTDRTSPPAPRCRRPRPRPSRRAPAPRCAPRSPARAARRVSGAGGASGVAGMRAAHLDALLLEHLRQLDGGERAALVRVDAVEGVADGLVHLALVGHAVRRDHPADGRGAV